ncbi:MAG: SDR family oxidoreductase [Rhodocyclales bacterium]|nr:SDR family oxidoreductase [Rhodocyclales bacterium]MBI5786577.1 SDR family oxidoreductase [Rhodocyclales bacterium]
MSDKLLVTGASGHLGQLVIAHLLDTLKLPSDRIIATTRHPEKLTALAARGVAVRAADFDDAGSLTKAFAGAQRLLLISTDALDRPGHRIAQHRNAVTAAAQAGVGHVVYTSMPMPEDSPLLIAPDHLGTEQALAASPLSWTLLRNCWYMENLFLSLPAALASGHWYSAAGDGKVAYISRADCTRAAAVVLAASDTGRTTYTLTGNEAFSTAAVAQRVSALTGKPISVVDVPLEGLIEGIVAATGWPRALAEIFASFDTNTKAGRVAAVTDDFRKLTGTAPQALDNWLAANRAALAGA